MPTKNAEHQRAWRERRRLKKEAELKKAEILTKGLMRTPFSEWISSHGDFMSVEMVFDTMGIEPPSFEDERDPRSASGEIEKLFVDEGNPEDSPYVSNKGALGRAEIMVGSLIDAAAGLANLINEYKRKEITDRIHEIETGDLSDPETRKQALADIVRLKKMLDQLDKQVRWNFPQWKVTE